MNGSNHHQRPTRLETFLFGADYYPEQWTRNTRKDDVRRMREAGFNCVRMGEFAWAFFEPERGRYDFSLFDEQIELLGAAGIRTMLGTPTAAPPVWLTAEHPEILRVDADGRWMTHGSRQHACYSSPVFRERCAAVVDELASHYRGNRSVVGWQIDNEYFCHFRECYCENCRLGFRRYLREKYRDIEALNSAWGTAFWSQRYTSFDQIELPKAARPTQPNPSQMLDYALFLNEALVQFQHEQVATLRAANPEWWITHNFVLKEMDYLSLTAELDFAGFDYYPMFEEPVDRAARGAASLDKVRSFAGNFVVPELQSGPGGQGDFRHDEPDPGQMRLFAYHAAARGADGFLHFRFRTARSGAEQSWGGIIGHDNRPGARFEESCREGSEFARLGPLLLGTTISPEIGILLDYGMTELSHHPVTFGLPSPVDCGEIVHRTFYEAGYSVGYVNPQDSFASFKLLVLPCWPIIGPDLLERLTNYVQLGGTLLVTARSGIKDEHANMLGETPPGPLASLCGVRVAMASRVNNAEYAPNEFTLGPQDEARRARTPASMIPRVSQSLWIECLTPVGEDTEVLGRWTEPPVAGQPASTLNRYGVGKVIYLGTFPDERNLKPLLYPLAGEANLVPLVSLPVGGIEVSVRSSGTNRFFFVLNHTPNELLQRGLPGGELIIGPSGDRVRRTAAGTIDLSLPGYDVAVIRVIPAA